MGGSVGFPNTHKLIVVGLDRLFIHHAAVLVVPLAEVLVHGLRRGLCVRVQRPQGSVFLAKGLQLGFESTFVFVRRTTFPHLSTDSCRESHGRGILCETWLAPLSSRRNSQVAFLEVKLAFAALGPATSTVLLD